MCAFRNVNVGQDDHPNVKICCLYLQELKANHYEGELVKKVEEGRLII